MPRRPREEFAGAVHHVFARGNDKALIFRDDRDPLLYLGLLDREVARTGWQCLSYCLMPNHVHLLIETPQPNLGIGMQRLHSRYAQRFNERHEHVGHVFQGRYGAVRMISDSQLWAVVAYIARNPVEAGLCDSAAAWRWSSHNAVLGAAAPTWLDTDRLLWHLAGAGGAPRARYAELTA